MFEFANPWLLILLPLPVLLRRFFGKAGVTGGALHVPERLGGVMLGRARGQKDGVGQVLAQPLLWACWGLLVLAAAGPRDLAPVSALKVTGRDLAIALDLSGSMVRDDFFLNGAQVTRLEAVQKVGSDFVRRRGGDRVALIVFGSEAYYAAPFTFDTDAVAQRIEQTQIGISGRATNISDGLGLALKRMQDSDAQTRVVILLSDGVNNAGATNPRGVAELAAQMGVRVHTIALGPKDLETAQEGERGVVDVTTLRAISQISGGESFRVKTSEDLMAVSAALDQLEATDSDGLAAQVFREYWVWPAALAGLCAMGFALRETA